jgi:hypothetical protein
LTLLLLGFTPQKNHGAHVNVIGVVDEGRMRQRADDDGNEINTTTVTVIPTARTTGRGQDSDDIQYSDPRSAPTPEASTKIKMELRSGNRATCGAPWQEPSPSAE